MVHLQREPQKHCKVKSGITYTGGQRLKQREEQYTLLDKRTYCNANADIPFWEGASLECAEAYDWSQLRLVVGGDGANWIGEGAAVFANGIGRLDGNGIGRLDGFHLARACGQAFGKELGRQLYEVMRGGKLAEADRLLAEAEPVNRRGAEKTGDMWRGSYPRVWTGVIR